MARFDEIELHGRETNSEIPVRPTDEASLPRRMMSFIIDLSLFVAAAIAISPILPEGPAAMEARAAVIAFLILLSLYYLSLGWMVWGKTIGGAIMNVRLVSGESGEVTIRQAVRRWLGTILSLTILGLGFLPALFGEHRSLADRLSGTRTITRA